MANPQDFLVKNLGINKIPSPLKLQVEQGAGLTGYVEDSTRILANIETYGNRRSHNELSFEKAGPREDIYFRPAYVTAAMVTCGGLSPGLNNVIRSLVMQLHHRYGVRNILGFRYGYKGLNPANGFEPVALKPETVESIHRTAGSFLGCSRGAEDPKVMADCLESHGVNMLFAIGGDGTMRGAHTIWEEVERRGLEIAIVGVPKTIDNDIEYVYKTFGFDSAVEEAKKVLQCAHAEAKGAPNGIGLVKVMGRDAGFIAAHATLASREVNFTLLPEFPFDLHGANGFLAALEARMRARQHAVIVVAEGAGQELMGGPKDETDKSGNVRFRDIGVFLRDEITGYFKEIGMPVNLKYIDPSYTIRSILPNANDSIYCDNLSRYAVHAAMAGKTDMVIGLWHNVFTHVPITAIGPKKCVSRDSTLWFSVLEATGQPHDMRNG